MSKTKSKTYLLHELSSYLPLLEGEEFDDLVEDIKQHGQIEPATIYEGKILDGRNRYRACKILKRELIIREWKPSKATGSTPLQYVISENIMRRHLNEAQKGEIGMLLYEEVEKQVKEEGNRKRSETMKERFEKGEIKSLGGKEGFAVVIPKENLIAKSSKIEGTTAYRVAKKVRVKPRTMEKVKAIKEVAIDDKEIAKEWERAKKGDSSISAVYREVSKIRAIKKLPEDLQTVVKKEEAKVKEAKKKGITFEPVITIKEAKVIAEIPSVELRKQEVKERERVKQRQVTEIKKKKDLAEGKVLPKPKYFDKDASKVKTIEDICKKAVNELTFAGLEGYGKVAIDACIKMMKILFEHLREELKKAGEVAPRKVIDTDAY